MSVDVSKYIAPILPQAVWEPPEKNDTRILGMPNIPKPLHMLAPRTIMGKSKWDKERKLCYFKAKYTCEACGEYMGPGKCNAHEVYSMNYTEGYAEFVRLICLCPRCHVRIIHSGRALTLFHNGDPLYNKGMMLDNLDAGFAVIAKWNAEHDDPIYLNPTFIDYLLDPDIGEEVAKLLDKYNLEIYTIGKSAEWGKWRLIYNGKEYPTPYKSIEEWKEKMQENNKKEKIEDPFGNGKDEWNWA